MVEACRISVCLASYNGERFIADQLASILPQLGAHDELILSDDGSTDRTVEIARAFPHPCLIICAHRQNVGHVRNFERAIAMARGGIILLSDQDDIWRSDKLDKVLEVFSREPRACIVIHALTTIDEEGEILEPPVRLWNPARAGRQAPLPFVARQLIRCQVAGCAVAFRRKMTRMLLPFPGPTYSHDHWISVAAPFCGETFLSNDSLVLHRLHGANLSPRRGLSWRRRIMVRLKLVALIAIAIKRRIVGPAWPA